jgi:subtilisin family serine protease
MKRQKLVTMKQQKRTLNLLTRQTGAPWGMGRVSSQTAWLPLNGRTSASFDFIYEYFDTAGEGTVVYIFDTGCNLSHTQFNGVRKECFFPDLQNSCHDEDGREYLGAWIV